MENRVGQYNGVIRFKSINEDYFSVIKEYINRDSFQSKLNAGKLVMLYVPDDFGPRIYEVNTYDICGVVRTITVNDDSSLSFTFDDAGPMVESHHYAIAHCEAYNVRARFLFKLLPNKGVEVADLICLDVFVE